MMRSRDMRSAFALGFAALTLSMVLGGPAVAEDVGPGSAVDVPAADGTLDTYPSAGSAEAPPTAPRPRQARRRARRLARPKAPDVAPLAILPPGSAEPAEATGSIPAEPTGSIPMEAKPAETKPKAGVKAVDRHATPKGTPQKTATLKHPAAAWSAPPPTPPLPPRIVRPALVKPAKAPSPAPVQAPMPVQASQPPMQSIASIPASNPVRARADPRPAPVPLSPPMIERPDSDEALTQIAPVDTQPAAASPLAVEGAQPASAPAATWTSADQTLANDSRRQVLGELRKEQSRYADEALRQLREEKQEGF